MSTQSEAMLEKELIEQLSTGLGYDFVHISDEDGIRNNLKAQLERFIKISQFSNLIDTYIFSGQEPIKEEVFKCLEQRPSVLKAREIGERIIEKMKKFVEVYLRGVAA